MAITHNIINVDGYVRILKQTDETMLSIISVCVCGRMIKVDDYTEVDILIIIIHGMVFASTKSREWYRRYIHVNVYNRSVGFRFSRQFVVG